MLMSACDRGVHGHEPVDVPGRSLASLNCLQHSRKCPVQRPPAKTRVQRPPGPVPLWHITPGRTGPQLPHDPVQHHPIVPPGPPRRRPRKQPRQHVPLPTLRPRAHAAAPCKPCMPHQLPFEDRPSNSESRGPGRSRAGGPGRRRSGIGRSAARITAASITPVVAAHFRRPRSSVSDAAAVTFGTGYTHRRSIRCSRRDGAG